MPRGFTYAIYTADDGNQYLRQVDLDQAGAPERGWAAWDGATPMNLWPQRAVPRKVYGVSPTTGRRGSAVVGAVTALLWTGLSSSFTLETNDPAAPTDTLTVTRRRGESFPMSHQIVQPASPGGA
jgi:hypothetical protein